MMQGRGEAACIESEECPIAGNIRSTQGAADENSDRGDVTGVFKTHVAFVDHLQEVFAPFLVERLSVLVPLRRSCRNHGTLVELMGSCAVTHVVRNGWGSEG